MSSESLHAPRERLQPSTLLKHHAIVSIQEEMDAVDWYRQRADDCDDPELKAILEHNMREEIEHACMALEWLRRNDPDWDGQLREYLFAEGPIQDNPASLEGHGDGGDQGAVEEGEDEGGPGPEAPPTDGGFTVGDLK